MRVLGVDPGLTRCGVGVVDGRVGGALRAVSVGVIRTPAADDVAHRLLAIERGLAEAIATHRPDVVAIERVFSQNNVSTVMGTAQASGVAMVVAARHGLPVVLHTPSEVKAAVTGNGRADKAQVTAMVTRILGLVEAPRPADAADALALAICHVWRGTSVSRLDDALAAAARPSGPMRTAAEPIRSRIPGAARTNPRFPERKPR
ncbi:crossover junction endodeoxyribonuclease RuvC [Mumia sp. zg.B17]|uniref:crossover junction endodeoxyribonuclease RuvC n=1 Tax=unclassified Mumia TaxID=2621872 RepID=UPI001C6DE2FE|nr:MULTISPECIES: crossover junction endodeoxyribonuclease RuvC [unclassified Mumia]MBW9206068.1 crossover junction endodeoxyribonuclease RuvC [Mumia sp. zg.B17]MDD9349243.1 crossover junction endodeoxyribonuclease RuvC [Mumia sp.]